MRIDGRYDRSLLPSQYLVGEDGRIAEHQVERLGVVKQLLQRHRVNWSSQVVRAVTNDPFRNMFGRSHWPTARSSSQSEPLTPNILTCNFVPFSFQFCQLA